MLSFKFTIIINAFFICLNGYFGFETNENTTTVIKGIGLGNMILNLLIFSVSNGLNGALETLVSHSFGASQDPHASQIYRDELRKQCGRFLNIARLINTLFMICPTVILFLFAGEILITFFKQNSTVSEIAI